MNDDEFYEEPETEWYNYQGIAARKEYEHADPRLYNATEPHPDAIAETILQFMREERAVYKARLQARLLPILTQQCILATQHAESYEEDVSGNPPNTLENLQDLLNRVEDLIDDSYPETFVEGYVGDYIIQQTVPSQYLGACKGLEGLLEPLWQSAPRDRGPLPINTTHINSPKLDPDALEVEESWAQEIDAMFQDPFVFTTQYDEMRKEIRSWYRETPTKYLMHSTNEFIQYLSMKYDIFHNDIVRTVNWGRPWRIVQYRDRTYHLGEGNVHFTPNPYARIMCITRGRPLREFKNTIHQVTLGIWDYTGTHNTK